MKNIKSKEGIFSFLLFFILLTLFSLGTAAAQSVSVDPVSTTGYCPDANDQFSVTVVVDSDIHILQAAKLDLLYDSSVLEVISIDDDGLLGTVNTDYFVEPGSGDDTFGLIHYGVTNIGVADSPANGDFITINFQIKSGASDGTYDLTFDCVELKDNTPAVITGVTENNGNVILDCGGQQPEPSVAVSPVHTTGYCPDANDQFSVTVVVDSDTHILQAAKLDLLYDSSVLEVISIDDDGLLGTVNTDYFVEPGSGDDTFGLIHYGVTNIGVADSPVNGDFITINFQIKSGASDGTYDLTFDCVELKNEIPEVIPGVSEINGDVIIDCENDNVDPVVHVDYPNGGTASGSITLEATATDTDGTITDVEFSYSADGGSNWNALGSYTGVVGDVYTYPWDTTAVADGTDYLIKAVATDNDGATAEDTSDSTFTIDNTCACDFCLELEAGLNFVSIPKTIDASDISGNTIFDIDEFSSEQVQYFNPNDGWDSNPDVLPCRGFQVLKNAPMTVCVDFVTDSQPQQELYTGWNMIGHVHTEDMVVYEVGNPFDFTSKTGLEDPEDTLLFMQLNTYSQTTGWTYHPNDFSDMTPGVGYYILMKQDTLMYGMQ